ncbi:unnamed protein product [Cercospora beticola]|nr:unnamed protein product [Cercospora beticola]
MSCFTRTRLSLRIPEKILNGTDVCPGTTRRLSTIINAAARDAPYFTPAQEPPAGTAKAPSDEAVSLFKPLTLRGMTMQNRIMVSPMCQYSAQDGHQTDWHMAHLSSFLMRGPGLTMVEATAVEPQGRTTPEDTGLWKYSQIEPLRRIVDFAHSQGQKIGIQLAHAGRKASMVAPWLAFPPAISEVVAGGWPSEVIGPSSISWSDRNAPVRAMDPEDIDRVRAAFRTSARRAVHAGVDAIECHAAHGYLLHSFCSPLSNVRTDDFGGSFDNRTRLLRLVIEDLRAVMPTDMPLFVRISGSDGLEDTEFADRSWTPEDAVHLAQILAGLGVDLIDVSYGGSHVSQKVLQGDANQAHFAHAIKQVVGDEVAVGTVGNITTASVAQAQIDKGLNVAVVGRQFLKDPNLVANWAKELGVQIAQAHQLSWMIK